MEIHELAPNVDLSKCILWQYQNATRLKAIVEMMQDATNMASSELWKKAFYVFDLDKDISSSDSDYQYRVYGLQCLTNLFGLKRPSWVSGGLSSLVSVNVWRRYLKGMIWLMDSDGSCSDINKWLKIIFPDYDSFVIDSQNMTIVYKFYPVPSSTTDEWQMLHIDGFLPHPAGVLATVNYINDDAVLGLDSQTGTEYSEDVNFNNFSGARFAEGEEE